MEKVDEKVLEEDDDKDDSNVRKMPARYFL